MENGIETIPLESQHSIEAYDRMETKMATSKNLLTLPHSHLYPIFFPKDFKGKIIFIQRDPRAVAASAYPFLKQIPPMKPYFDEWKFQNIDEYARHDAQGFNLWGSCDEFNTAWKEEAKKNPDLDILFLQFEGIIK